MAQTLPCEILCKILEYLPFSDRLQLSLVCKNFLWAFQTSTPRLQAKTGLTFDNDDKFLQNFGRILSSHQTGIGSLTLKDISASIPSLADLKPFMQQLTSFTLINCSISTRDLFNFLRYATSLKTLGLINCRELFIAGLPLFKPDEIQVLKATLATVKEINLSDNQFINDCIFEDLFRSLSGVSSIVLDGCKIYCTQYLSDAGSPSPSRLTSRCVLAVVTSMSKQIKSLSFKNTSLEGTALKQLAGITGLNITKLDLAKCTGIGQDALLEFCQHQKELAQLNIDACRRILVDNPQKSLELFQLMWNLTCLSMRNLSMPKGFASCLAQLDKLTCLDISEIDIPDQHIAEAINDSKFNLEKLAMSNFAFNPEKLVSVIARLSNLTELNLDYSSYGVTDQVLQEVTKHLLKLRKLQLHKCTRLTDLGFAGVQTPGDDFEISGVRQIAQESGRIFPGTRAEAELLDIVRKQKEVHAKLISHQSSGSSKIDDLNLTFLDVGQIHLTDHCLAITFAFRELRHLNVAQCNSISDVGFILLAENNPGLESLIARRTKLTDAGLTSIAQLLPRLTHLDVEGCTSLTSESILALSLHCRNLRYLNVSFCLKVRVFAVEELSRKISSLRNVEMRGLHIAECLDD